LRVFVTGARGMLGTDVCEVLGKDHDVAGVDIESAPDTAGAISAAAPEVIVHLAAYAKVDEAEDEKDAAFNCNAVGTMNVAKASRDTGARLVYLSTDYVFDGAKASPYVETDTPAPINFYGLTKLFGERYVSSLNPRHLIVRTSWLFGPNGKNFVDAILEKARAGRALQIVNDQRGCPTYTYHLAGGLKAAIEKGIEGILHMTNSGETTWYEFAKAALEIAGVETEVKPVGSASYPAKAKRPVNSVLRSAVMERSGLEPLPDWREGLRHHLGRKEAAGR
jgi:dTDP-4-dehydrorhamnose reductase